MTSISSALWIENVRRNKNKEKYKPAHRWVVKRILDGFLGFAV